MWRADEMWTENITDSLDILQSEFHRIVVTIIILALVLLVYKMMSRSVKEMVKRFELEPHVENSFRLILRVGAIVAASTAVMSMFELPTTWFLGGSAVLGAALGFGSSQTINNFVAGFYVIISRPFHVKDYVRIGDVEGQVEEITINYTKLYTPSFNLLQVPNVQVMNSRIVNCTHEGFIKYTFNVDLPHGNLSNEEIISKCIKPAIEEFHKKYQGLELRKPEYYFDTTTPGGRSFKIRIFIPRGEAKTLYQLKPELTNMIISRWDEIRRTS